MIGTFVHLNLPTKNVAAAREFYSKVGFDINTDYSSDQNVFVVIAQNVQLILADEGFLKQLGETRAFADTSTTTEGSVAISVDSREKVDEVFEAAIAAGGTQAGDTVEEVEFGLYARAFYDLDGHRIDINHMSAQ